MGQSYAVPDDLDEADLMAELDALDADLAAEEPVSAGGMPSYLQETELPELPGLPSAPATEEEALPPLAQRT